MRALGFVLLCVAVVVSIVTLRLMTAGAAGLKRAERAMEQGDRDAAIVALEDAAKAYVPGGRHVPRALKELAVLAKAAELRGEDDRALKIWEVIRRAVLATRHVFQPNMDVLEDAEREMLRMRQKEGSDTAAAGATVRPKDPSALLSILLFFGLIAWIAGAVSWILRPELKPGIPLVPRGLSVAVCLAGLGLWLFCAWWV